VNRHQILQQGGATLADALGNTPGVTGTGFAAGASRPVIRGFDAQRVRVLEDGISTFDVSDVGPDHGVPVDPLSAQRIEIVRGASTLRYGSQAIGGVVNAINNRVPLEAARPTDFRGIHRQLRATTRMRDRARCCSTGCRSVRVPRGRLRTPHRRLRHPGRHDEQLVLQG
jgi:outer membrane receptor protein involved in Fe transport